MEQAGFMQVVLGSAMNIAMFVLVVTGVMKLFQAASDLRDMRQMLQNQLKAPHVPSETPDLSMPPISLESLQSLANAVGLKPEPITPEVIPPHSEHLEHAEPVPVGAKVAGRPTISISKNLVW